MDHSVLHRPSKVCQALALLLASACAPLAMAHGPLDPVKITAAEAAGPAFTRKDARAEQEQGRPVTDLVLLQSKDKRMTAGMYKAGPSDDPINAYPEDEFCYFLSGSVKLTSADGTVLEVKAGEAVVLHKGWKGRWTTSGYTKYYVVYDSP